jgi:hypothetical protein
MSDDTAPQTIIEYTEDKEVKGFYVLPTRRITEINDGDWTRWKRSIESIPKQRPIWRDVAIGGGALAAESIFVALNTREIGWAVAAAFALIVGGLCYLFDRQAGEDISVSVETVLQDMTEVYARSPHREEIVSPK